MLYDTGEVELAYDEWEGTTPPVLFLHGLSGQRALTLVEAREDHRAYAYDHRGHGESGRTPGAYTFLNWGRDVVAFLGGVVREPALLVGHSLGAMAAIYAAAHAPHLVRGAFLIDPPLYAPEVGMRDERGPFTALVPLAGRAVEELLAGRMSPERAANVSRLDSGVMPMIVDGTMFDGWDTDVYLRLIECPVVLEHGDRAAGSAIYPGEHERAMALLGNVEVLHLAGSGHVPQFDAGDRLLPALKRFIREG